jgi:hypothetical protein
LLIDTSEIDFVSNHEDYEKIKACILTPRKPGVYKMKL